MMPEKIVQKSEIRTSCHFKQVDDNTCFSFKFVNKKECHNCWKRYDFMAGYLPMKKDYEERQEEYRQAREGAKGKAMNWWEYLF